MPGTQTGLSARDSVKERDTAVRSAAGQAAAVGTPVLHIPSNGLPGESEHNRLVK